MSHSIWIGIPDPNRPRVSMAFTGPVACLQGAAFDFFCDQAEAFQPGLSYPIDPYGHAAIEGDTLSSFGLFTDFLRQALVDYPEEWSNGEAGTVHRTDLTQQLSTLHDILSHAKRIGSPVEIWGE